MNARRAWRMLPAPAWVLILLALSLGLLSASGESPSAPTVVTVRLDDTIQPVSAEYLGRALGRAGAMHAAAVIVEMNTPGGLLESTREMVHSILGSPVPVVVWVGPSGSRAGSAGFFLLESADVAAMAPGTNAGAAHPVTMGSQPDPIMKAKLENDAAAFLRSYTAHRGRNAEAAEDAVRNSKSYTEGEAQQLKLIEIVAPDERALVNALDGRTITRFGGETVTLHTRGAQLIPIEPTVREKLLGRLVDPNLAVLMFVAGALLIYLEFNIPGTIIPGTLGTLLVVLALFALNLLPIHYTSVVLVAAGIVLLLLEAKFASHGVLATAGLVCLVFGTLTLVDGPIPELRVHLSTALAIGLAFGLITLLLVRLAVRARHAKSLTGPDALLGQVGVAQQPLDPTGQVLVRGELWQAESAAPVSAGEQVRILAVRQLKLLVERVPERP